MGPIAFSIALRANPGSGVIEPLSTPRDPLRSRRTTCTTRFHRPERASHLREPHASRYWSHRPRESDQLVAPIDRTAERYVDTSGAGVFDPPED